MCGIVGLIVKNDAGKNWMKFLPAATHALTLRGPDAEQHFTSDETAFGHCRLSIIDLSAEANQPMTVNEHVIIYNGELFNYRELKKELEQDGVLFKTHSDTEVLLQLFKKNGSAMFESLNGFFAFAIYDTVKKTCLIARDRFGVKPLYYYEDGNCLAFASEIKALLQFPITKEMDHESLLEYLQLNYIPGPATIFSKIKKLQPGHYMMWDGSRWQVKRYYSLPEVIPQKIRTMRYDEACTQLFGLLDDAVRLRLISDVPLGSFLSGGIDSSIVSGLASRHTGQLKTFSIGYAEHGFFDETDYARTVARHFATDHTVFSLSRTDLHESLDAVLDYLDEPFGDSSALPVYILSKLTRQHVKVALSGDGADELFGGYQKHIAHYRAVHPRLAERSTALLDPIWRRFPKSRNSLFSNRIRQFNRFAAGYRMDPASRYWRWCSIADLDQSAEMLKQFDEQVASERRQAHTQWIQSVSGLNDIMMNDVHLVLPDDMLRKVDSMSMANGLEVRTPFLDYRIAEFAFSIPASFKLDRMHRKKIVHDVFRKFLPAELYHRPKRGFEIPLHSFLTTELKLKVDEITSAGFLAEQGIFSAPAVQQLKQQLFSPDPEDSAARMWGLLVFQHWWKKVMQ